MHPIFFTDFLIAAADGAVIKDQIIRLLQQVMKTLQFENLVQFWGLVKIEDDMYLTTCDQPFALKNINDQDRKKLCEYRKLCLECLIPVDEDDDDDEIGPPGRVFRSGLPEYAKDVCHYTSVEYPQRDYAVYLPTTEYWALPIYHHSMRRLPVGVLEIVSSRVFTGIPRYGVLEKLQFFLPTYEEDEDEDEAEADYGDPTILLPSLMEILKECLGISFKIASGQELGQKLTVEVIKISSKDEYDSFEICNTTGIESTPRLGEVRGEGMMQLDFSSQQVDAANGSMNGIHEQQNGSVGSTPRLAKAQGGEGMTQVDFSPQQVDTTSAYMNGVHGQQSGISGSPPRTEHTQELTVGVDVVHNSLNGIYEQNNGIVESPHRQELPQNIENIAHDEGNMEIDVANPERGGASIEPSDREVINIKKQKSSYTLKSKLGITREDIEQNSWRSLKDAAKFLKGNT
ncbi:unnamed protein product [Coffea canephora]|uniref:DH200=94 genomic scaffold, scaffold_2639 n=1 Tax=Coffea canephora TaxID=49390 RepID=A0A068VKN9_COFCA|nr:unnamed protein product [Coffea canephora]